MAKTIEQLERELKAHAKDLFPERGEHIGFTRCELAITSYLLKAIERSNRHAAQSTLRPHEAEAFDARQRI